MPTNTVQAVSPYYNPTIEEVSTVPNIKSAKKRVKVAAAKTLQNKMINSQLKTEIKKANVAIESNAADKAEAVKVAVKSCCKGHSAQEYGCQKEVRSR